MRSGDYNGWEKKIGGGKKERHSYRSKRRLAKRENQFHGNPYLKEDQTEGELS